MTVEPKFLWVTRASPFNLLTAQRLRAIGYGVLVAPLFDVRAVRSPPIPWKPDLIAFTSVNGVRHHPYAADWAKVPVFAVGDATAAAARRRGYLDVQSAKGDVQDLQALILRSVVIGMRLLHFSAQEPAGDLAAYLRCRGFDAIRYCVYETVPRSLEKVRSVLAEGPRVHGIVVHSPKGGRRAADLLADTGWSGQVFCLSQACAREFRDLQGLSIKIAPRPNERALMETIRQDARAGSGGILPVQFGTRRYIADIAARHLLRGANDNSVLEPTPA